MMKRKTFNTIYIKYEEKKEGGTAKHNFALGDRVTRMMATLI